MSVFTDDDDSLSSAHHFPIEWCQLQALPPTGDLGNNILGENSKASFSIEILILMDSEHDCRAHETSSVTLTSIIAYLLYPGHIQSPSRFLQLGLA